MTRFDLTFQTLIAGLCAHFTNVILNSEPVIELPLPSDTKMVTTGQKPAGGLQSVHLKEGLGAERLIIKAKSTPRLLPSLIITLQSGQP